MTGIFSRALGAAVREDLRHQRLGAVARVHDGVDVALEVARRWPSLRELAVAEDRAEDVVEVVRDAAGEVAHRLHLLGLAQLRLEALASSSARTFSETSFTKPITRRPCVPRRDRPRR